MDLTSYKDRSRLSEASNAGYSARLHRKPITANPFDEGTSEHLAFNHYWGRADQDEHLRQGVKP
ncbi:TPA: hypothetical protein R4K21_003189 [Stenotrophomonas maltophilia]|nr:hypothetical protein [Stenotrophomonas maltophilia]